MNSYDSREDEEEFEYEDNYESDETGYGEETAHQAANAPADAADYGGYPHQPAERQPTDEFEESYAATEQPRESRKERRRREALERQAQADAQAAALSHSASAPAHSEPVQESAEIPQRSDEIPAHQPGFFGRRFKKNHGEGRMEANQATTAPIEITLPSADRIDPAALLEFGLDPNTLASMGMDPATLPQFEPEFLTELGINPQIVVEILRRQKSAEQASGELGEIVEGMARARFDMSPAAWIGRYRKVQRWAPAAAAVAGLTTTGSIWFMSGGDDPKAVPEVNVERPAGEDGEATAKEAIVKNPEPSSANEPAPAGEPSGPQEAVAEAAPTDSAAEPVSLAMSDLPGLPGDSAAAPPPTAPAEDLPGLPGETSATPPSSTPSDDLPGLPGDTAAATPTAAPADGLPGLPGDSGSAPPPAPPADDLPGLPGISEAPPIAAAADSSGEKKDTSKPDDTVAAAIPAIGGLGAAALAAEGLGDPPAIDAPPVKGLEAPPASPPVGSNDSEPPPGLPATQPDAASVAEAPPGLPAPAVDAPKVAEAPPVVDAPKVAEAPPEPPGLPKESESGPAASAGKAALAGLGAGLGAAAIVEGAKTDEKAAESLPIPKRGDSEAIGSSDLPSLGKSEPPTEEVPGGLQPEAGSQPPGSLSGLPQDIPQTPTSSAPATPEQKKITEADADWPAIPNGRGRILRALASTTPVSRGIGSTAAAAAIGTGAGIAMGTAVTAVDGSGTVLSPGFETAPAEIAPIKHTVQSGENFWTISRDYYGSGRYYKALWAANSDKVAKIEELHVGDIVRIPAMEYLDKSLIETPNVAKSRRAPGSEPDENPPAVARSRDSRALRTGNDIESVPIGGAPGMSPSRKVPPTSEGYPKEIISEPIGETAASSGYIRHRVQPGETLRTIAAERLGNARRADEIVELNSDVLDDVRTPLEPGVVLKLPVASGEE